MSLPRPVLPVLPVLAVLAVLPVPADAPGRLLRHWSVSLQQRARRNAMVALTDCTQRRVEREEVERFLAERAAARRTAEVRRARA